ncbi:MAG: glycosyltransferase [Deltaproteobacteria bacterium]|nr:glycosyltransferase [Deltaproteobacteria bacterium]
MNELVSVIILNWNGQAYIKGCLDSVLSQDYGNVEIIVVDNASEDESADMVRKSYRDVMLIQNQSNLGFSVGNNIGIQRARGDFILILNNDTELDRGCITAMKRSIDRDARYGSSASKIYLKDSPGTVDAAGIVVFPDGLSIGRGRFEPGFLYENEEDVFFSSGCCALYRREMLEDVKIFGEYYDEDFFAYAEDTDLGWRARLRGWKCVYAPTAAVYHARSASSGNYSPMKAFLVERNRMWLEVKNFPFPLIVSGHFYTLLRYACQAYGALSGQGAAGAFSKQYSKRQLIGILLRSYALAAAGFPKMLKKRRQIQARKLIGIREILNLMRSFGIDSKSIALAG